ncbi:epidermal retinol dehydrogenase 2-like [Phytophthora cinnamomi]|uniref:epidermal retinol dehydrogenase 2-like n=1 Tax=Phytophthora cinnamomi TaxID=4785 RepID=UPI00355A75AD|nr:epidermal retinol dehydrogenase 2-like [Phytophthora cinnamomi]
MSFPLILIHLKCETLVPDGVESQKLVAWQVVVVTGGAMGLGRMLSIWFAQLGAVVLGWDVDASNGQKVVREIASVATVAGGEAHSFQVDVGDRSPVYEAGRKVLEQFQAEDILVNNAGVVCGRTLLATSDAANTFAHFWTVCAFLPEMVRRNRGHKTAS